MPAQYSDATDSKPFLTGSRVYGTPREDSDIDLVALVSDKDLYELVKAAEATGGLGSGQDEYEDGRSLRFGKLNLLCVTKKRHFDIWKLGTLELMAMAPVTRDHAIQHLAKLRREHRISGW
jgi:hypothetical protein